MTYPKMKPCPECGQPIACYTYNGWSRCECDRCSYSGPIKPRKLDAIRGHNTHEITKLHQEDDP